MAADLSASAPPAGDSREQREAECYMLAELSERLGVSLAPRRLLLSSGARIELDGASPDLSVLVEAWAHQGPPKAAQRNKVLTDAFKLAFAATIVGTSPDLILLFSDSVTARAFEGKRWASDALTASGIRIEVVDLPPDVRANVVAAKKRQYR